MFPRRSIDQTAKNRTSPGPSSENKNAIQPKQKKMENAKHNLESFPTEILEKIFIRTNDVGLLHLANTCTRFEAIAQTVFSNRYSHQYFIINDEKLGGDPELYAAQFDHFGSHINAIQLNHIYQTDSEHWAMKLIQPHLNRIEKLTIIACRFKAYHGLPQALNNVTHLAFQNVSFEHDVKFDLPECHNLIELEVRGTYGLAYRSLLQTIRNNPALQRLILKDSKYITSKTINLIAHHLNNIKELVLVDDGLNYMGVPIPTSSFEGIVESFKHLESISISVTQSLLNLLQRLAKECKSLKHLGLFRYDNEADNDIIRSFPQIKSLYLTYISNDFIPIGVPVEDLPNLCHLSIELGSGSHEYDANEFSEVFSLLQRSQSLQRITIVLKSNEIPKSFITAALFKKFIETITIAKKTNAKIEVEKSGELIGYINANGVVWRNKLTHWKDCDKNDTTIRLLDLAEYRDTSNEVNNAADQSNLLDKICDYLDLGSLAALAETSEQTERLVNTYVKTHVKKQKAFLLTDEFNVSKHIFHLVTCGIFKKLKFAQLMTGLHVCILQCNTTYDFFKLIEHCELLDELSIYNKNRDGYWPKIQTDLSHFVYDSPYSMGYAELIKFVESFTKVEKIECINAGLFNDLIADENNTEKFGSLRMFIFNYRGESQMKNLKTIFKGTRVELVPVSPKKKRNYGPFDCPKPQHLRRMKYVFSD